MPIIRRLRKEDYKSNFFNILTQLSKLDTDEITYETFSAYLDNLSINHQIYVIEENGEIVATGSLLIESKIIHNFGKVAHIEDVVVDVKSRGKNYGKEIVYFLINKAKQYDCYKAILDTNKDNVPFYKKCGFVEKEQQMVKYLHISI